MDPQKFERVEIASADALWRWLEAHHGRAESVWLVTWKIARRERYVSREAVLDALIAYGWIDGRRMKLDAERTMQLISPRRETRWARSYKERAARLEAEGRMRAPGRRAIAESRRAGHWTVSDPVDDLEMPTELAAALEAAGARAWWDAAAPSYRRNVLRWIASAKRAETLARRVATVTQCAKNGEKVPQF